ncbi:cation-transporting ATPase [Candidatus Saccharibacteria bacterium CG11_big_fil_rev_8_21_14_0_20_41_19]|nr:HAD-IC family P-type ATPase [Candidatus Saccharibacteria bacterium]OIP86347.1 MAG: cation-transporting ATPase [Candidatus Saccharibacteria bacterium CG2_30_41_52]PIQ71130.1 MAG: cation-transporting ATPase [Candidatus Saccharibacteria bacterium CG11_big_fil_rev_8_21_14_0_20_41_19]PIZ59946.1 MAG: cation-transporting ATPase [Candidatus Saccharibacteria bacterium CG_4_10_14_0_2_um_filter_41_11]PJC30005.1 MAG: cation-transporting ATPase [Candidatus Saccharibacteria bacterium CG_4_9_14_0_2_um_filt
MKDFLVILRRNFLSPIVIAILILAAILLFLNETRDAWFISVVIILNTLLAIVQEVRAQRALKKLELMSAPLAHSINADGMITDIMFDQLQVGDKIQLNLGDEVPADGRVLTSAGLETDESMLTGESASVDKSVGSTVYAASAVVAGSATVHVMAVGVETKVGAMSVTLKRYVPQLTPIQHAIARAITWLTYGALGLSVLVIFVYSLSGESAVSIFKTITSAAVTVVPEGLLLASSLLLAFGSLKLAQAKVLPQKLAAIEAMALLNVLCVDKTGTLTSDEISFEKFELFDESAKDAAKLIGIVAHETSSGSATNNAIIAGFPVSGQYKVLQTLAFSSARKLSGVRTKLAGKTYTILIGAPEYLEVLAPVTDDQKRNIESLASVGKRVLLVAEFADDKTSLKDLKSGSGRAMGIIILTNELRQGVEKTVNYLQQRGVSLRVISGDNPDTVKYIAGKAGIVNHHKVITGAQLAKISDDNWDALVAETTIFARVLPEQKERLVDTFKRLGNFTGMVGDGVNDALALKKADLGIAMYAGAAATRRVADIVLLNNSFNSLPLGMRMGNRIMQSIELIASLFFHKIIYGVILLLSTLAMSVVYPFLPRHITFMNIFLVTLPTIIWALFTPTPRHRISPRYFWQDTLMAVAPIAALSGLAVTLTYTVLRIVHPLNPQGVSTTTVIIATLFGIYLVFLVPRMFDIKNNRKAKLARLFYVSTVLLVMTPSFGVSLLREFFDFTMPAWQNTWPLMIVISVIAIMQFVIANNAGKRFKNREP